MDILDTIKQITTAHDATRFQPIHMGARDWANPGPVFLTREAAQAWLEGELRGSHRRDDWGYVVEITGAMSERA